MKQSPLTFLLENISKSSINLVYFLVTSNFLRSFKHQVNTIANLINLKDVSLEFVEVKNDIVHTGDALREFSERYSYHSDLVVLSEPTIFSEPLDNIFDAFKKQKLENDTHMMTYFAFKAPTHKNRAVCINNGSKVIILTLKIFFFKAKDFIPVQFINLIDTLKKSAPLKFLLINQFLFLKKIRLIKNYTSNDDIKNY